MRICFIFSLIAALLTCFAHDSVLENNCFENCEKTYVIPDQLLIIQNGIFVKFNNEWFQTETLFTDRQGLYIQNLRKDPCPSGYNECPKCSRCVSEERAFCPYCGGPIYRLK
jgi:hypothetical protein